MKELTVFEHDHVDVVDSRQVAEMVGKNHKDLMRSIREYVETLDRSIERNFAPNDFFIESTYKDSIGRTLPCYLLTKKGCDMVANKMTGEKGVLFTAAYVTAFEAMRKHIEGGVMALPKDYPSALRALADTVEQNQKLLAENEAQRQTIADFEPVRQYVDTILNSKGSLATSQIAADYGMSARALNRILREEGIQHSVNGQWILYKKYMGQGYTDSRTIHITHTDGRPDTKMQTYWTQKGRMMIHNILTARGIQAVMDRKENEEV